MTKTPNVIQFLKLKQKVLMLNFIELIVLAQSEDDSTKLGGTSCYGNIMMLVFFLLFSKE